MAKTKVFLDTSVLITALLSERGASFYLLVHFSEQCQFFINDYVLDEVIDVMQRKFSDQPDMAAALFMLLGVASVEIVSSPSEAELTSSRGIIAVEDAPILISAAEHCKYLLTLDQDFLQEEVTKFSKGRKLKIMKPGNFLHLLTSKS